MRLALPLFQLFWVAFCTLSMMAQTRLLLGLPTALGWLDGFVFGGTVFGYSFTHPNRWYRHAAWLAGLFGGLCFLASLMFSLHSIVNQWIALAPILFWLAYYGFQRPGNAGLRGRPLAKPLTVALTWAWVTVLLPTLPEQWPDLAFLLLGRVAFVFSLALAYDVCDAGYDHSQGLNTLATLLGLERSIALIYKSLAFSALCVGVNLYLHIYDFPKACSLFASLIFSAWWLRFLLHKRVWIPLQKPLIDGLMLLQFLLVFFAA